MKEKAERLNLDLMAFYGVGNHGGGPSIQLLDAMHHLDIPDMVYSTPDEYFANLDKEQLPVIKDELQHHARGCYSASTFIKRNNRKCENNLLAAEKLCSMAKHLTGAKYPKKKLDKAWKNLMFNHFHDIMGGCSIKKAYEDAGYLYGEIMSITEQEINFAMQIMAHNINTLRGKKLPSYKDDKLSGWKIWETDSLGTPAIVFNPHAWTVRMPVQINVNATKVTDEQDREVPFQIVRGDQTNGPLNKTQTIFLAEVEPMGYAVYRFFVKEQSQEEFTSELSVTEHSLENSRIRVEFSPVTGDICRMIDKKTQKVIIDGECSAILLDETECDTWAHGKVYLGEHAGRFEKPEFTVIEQGNVRATLKVKTYYNNSIVQREYSITPDSDCVKVRLVADFHEKHRSLKLAFPAGAKQTIAKIPFGTITRDNELGEEPCGSWIASGNLCIANDGKYGYDTTKEEVRLTVLRSAIYADHFGERDEFCEFMEQGIHECFYMLYPYNNNTDAEKKAEELNFELRVQMESFHEGSLPESMSCLKCDGEHVVITAVKQAEDGEDTVVRFYETEGEEEEVSIELFGKTIKTLVAHNEIKTMKMDGTEVNLIEW